MCEIKSCINDFYTYHIKSILSIIEHSQNGKRIWVEDDYGYKDYSQTTRSTYPEYMQFYFVKTPKKISYIYCEDDKAAWLDGYFNGSTRDYTQLFKNSLTGKTPNSKRMIFVFDLTIYGYFQELKDIEYMEQNYSN